MSASVPAPTAIVDETPPTNTVVPTFDAFISYSRRDAAFAERLHRALSAYAPPKGMQATPGRLKVFRDTADFTGSEYFAAIEQHLAASRKLILVCSPAAATSRYVDDEIARFIRLHGAGNVVAVLWQGLPNNEAPAEQAAQRAFPPALTQALAMPLAADFRAAVEGRVDTDAHRGAWMLLLANLLGVSRAEIEQREARRRSAVRRNWSLALGTVFIALLVLTLWALFEGERALARQLTAQASIGGGLEPAEVAQRVRIAREAVQRQRRLGEPTLQADTALRDALSQAPRRLLVLPPATLRVSAFSVDGEYLIAAEGAELRVHSLAGGSEVAQRVALARPLLQMVVSPLSGTIAALDDAGAVHAWSWPTLAPIGPPPKEVGQAPLSCIQFGGSALVATRLSATDAAPTLELLRWRPGEAALDAWAKRSLPRGMQIPPVAVDCLQTRGPQVTTAAAAGLLAMPAEVGAAPVTLAWFWPWHENSFAKSPVAPIEAWPAVNRIALDGNGRPVLLRNDGRVERPPLFAREAKQLVPGVSAASTFSADGNYALALEALHDPVVPLFKPTRIDLIDTRNGVTLRSVGDHAGLAAFVPDGRRFATVSGARIRLWDAQDGRETLRLRSAKPVQTLRFDAASQWLAAVAEDGSLEVFAIGAADEFRRLAPGGVVALRGGDGARLFGAGDGLVWAAPAPSSMPTYQSIDGVVLAAETSADGRFVVVATSAGATPFTIGMPGDAQLLLFEATSQGPALRHRGPWGEYRFDSAGRRLLVATTGGELRLVDTAAGSVVWTRRVSPITPPPAAALSGWRLPLAFADDGSVAAVATTAGMALLAGSDGRVLREDKLTTAAPMALSADGRLLARLTGNERIEVVPTAGGDIVAVASWPLAEVGTLRALMFSQGAKVLAAIGGTSFSTFMSGGHFAEERVIAWSLATGLRVARVPASTNQLENYQAQIGAQGDETQALAGLVWNPHRREFAGTLYPSLLAYYTVPSSMVRGTLAAWRIGDAGIEQTYRAGNSESLTARVFAPGGGALLVSGEDGHRRVIDTLGAGLVDASCRAVPSAMSPAEASAALGTLRREIGCR